MIGVSLFSADTMALTNLMLQLRAMRLRPFSIACRDNNDDNNKTVSMYSENILEENIFHLKSRTW